MPRKSRIDAAGALHHVIARGIDRGKIFQDPTDKRNFIDRLEDIIKDTETHCFAWAIIPNYFHLILKTGNVPIATVMRRLLTGHALYVKAMRRAKIFEKADERILGDGDFVKNVLADAEEKMKRRYAIQAKGVNLESLSERVAEIFDMPATELWIPGKHRWRVRAKSVLCYWANRELEISMSELSRRMNVSVMAISNAVRRGEKIAKELNISLY